MHNNFMRSTDKVAQVQNISRPSSCPFQKAMEFSFELQISEELHIFDGEPKF
jgi:hypothetical protein